MDNIGDWLYIVFIIIAGISGILSSGKKKRRQEEILGQPEEAVSFPEKTNPEKNIWDMFKEAEHPLSSFGKEMKKEKSLKKKPAGKAFLEGEKTGSSPVVANQTFDSEIETQEQETAFSVNFRDADDLKKAVIYSEILNRKY